MKDPEEVAGILLDLKGHAKEITMSNENPFNLTLREEHTSPLTSYALDHYVESLGYQGIDDAWIELSRLSAQEYLEKIMRKHQIEWFGYGSPKQSAESLAAKFIEAFARDARFFTHGISGPLREHPASEEDSSTALVKYPFAKTNTDFAQFNAYAGLSANTLYLPEGIVAIASQIVGSAYFKLFFD